VVLQQPLDLLGQQVLDREDRCVAGLERQLVVLGRRARRRAGRGFDVGGGLGRTGPFLAVGPQPGEQGRRVGPTASKGPGRPRPPSASKPRPARRRAAGLERQLGVFGR